MTVESGKVLDNVERLETLFNKENVCVISNTFVFNHHLLHPSMLDIFETVLKIEHNNNLKTLIISETGPNDRYGEYYRHGQVAIISLPYILEGVIESVSEKDTGLAIHAAIWQMMLHTFFHEVAHNISFAVDWDQALENGEAWEDDGADEVAEGLLDKVFGEISGDIPPCEEIPWFGHRIIEYLNENSELDWVKSHKEMIENNIVFMKGNDIYESMTAYWKDSSITPVPEAAEVEPVEIKPVKTATEPEIKEENVEPETIDMSNVNGVWAGPEESPTDDGGDDMIIDPFVGMGGAAATEAAETNDYNCSPFGGNNIPTVPPTATPVQPQLPGTAAGPDVGDGPFDNWRSDETERLIEKTEARANARTIARQTYVELANHMFNVCGFLPNGSFTSAGAAMAIRAQVNPLAGKIFSASNTIAGDGTLRWMPIENSVIGGRMFVNNTIPGYMITCRDHKTINATGPIAGQLTQTRINIIAQNPTKGSWSALEARAGRRIAWIINSNSNDWVGMVRDGVYHVKAANGSWVPA